MLKQRVRGNFANEKRQRFEGIAQATDQNHSGLMQALRAMPD
jgi:hypothetical protein